MSWTNNMNLPNWSGNSSNGINTKQLISTVNGLGDIGYISSSQFQSTNEVFISLFSTLFASTITGDTALWAEYPAVQNVNIDNNNINNVHSINVDSILPNEGDYVVMPGNGLQTDNIGSLGDTINLNNDIDAKFNNIKNIDNLSNVNNIITQNARVNNTLTTSNVKVLNISTSLIYTSTISTNFLSLSTIGGVYGIYLSTSLDALFKASSIGASLWSKYPAIQTVNMSNNSIDNVNDISISNNAYINRLVVRGGGLQMEGNAQFQKIDYGNYHNFTMDANVTVATSDTVSCPNYSGYYSNYYLGVNSIDATGILSGFAHTNAHLNLYTNQSAIFLGVVPFGHAELLSDNYRITFPPVIGETYDFRSAGIIGSTGSGANAWIRWNSDSTGALPNTSALLEINADSVFGVGTILGTSRITTTCGRNQILSGFTNQIYAGYAQILAPFTFANICSIEQTANFGALGGGVSVFATNGGGAEFGAVGLGARTDLVANNWITSNDDGVIAGSEMNLYCTDIMYLYTEGDMYIGAGSNYYGTTPNSPSRYGSNRPQRVHLSNIVDIHPTSSNNIITFNGVLDMCNYPIINTNISTGSISTSVIYSEYIYNSNTITTPVLDISGNAGGVSLYYNNDTNNLQFTFNDVGNKAIDLDNGSIYNVNTIGLNYLNNNCNSYIEVFADLHVNYKDISGVTLLRIGNIIDGSHQGNTNLSNDSNGYFHISNDSNLIALDNPVVLPYLNPFYGADNGTLVFQNTIDLSNNYINNVNGLFIDNISPNTVSEIQFTSPIRVDFINPFSGDYVSFPNNGIRTDQIGSYTTPYTGFNNDIDLFGNSILDVSGLYVSTITTDVINVNYLNPIFNNTINTEVDTILAIDTLSNIRDGDRGSVFVLNDFTVNGLLHSDQISANSNNHINITTSVDFGNNALSNITTVHSDFLQANNNSAISIINDINGNNKNIFSVNTLSASNVSTGYIYANSISTNTLTVINLENVSSISTNKLSVAYIENVSSIVANSIQSSRLSSQTVHASTSFFQTFVSAPTITTTSLNAYQISNVYDTRIRILQGIIPQTAGITNGTSSSYWGGTYSSNVYSVYNETVASKASTISISSITSVNANNTINISGIVSAPQLFVSSINNKVYPFWSTLATPTSTFSILGKDADTPIVLYSNVQFPPYTKGFYKVYQKSILSKSAGGTSQDIHGNIFYTQGTFPSTPSHLLDGYSALAYVNQDNCSSFTTLNTMVSISSITTRNICYYDSTGNTYGANLYMGNLVVEYCPTTGFSADLGNNIGF